MAILVITMGMILTPVLFALYDRIAMLIETQQEEAEADKPDEGTIIIAGVGRFGQIINRMLLANGHKTVIWITEPMWWTTSAGLASNRFRRRKPAGSLDICGHGKG